MLIMNFNSWHLLTYAVPHCPLHPASTELAKLGLWYAMLLICYYTLCR